jgi:hypothetical protein
MPSRRSVLASVATLSAGSLAGCAALDDRFVPATRTQLPPPPDAVTRVGRVDTEFGDDCPHGLAGVTARCYETAERLHLRTAFRLVTGESGCTSGWGNASFHASHRWALAPDVSDGLAATGSNVVPVDRDGAPFALASDQTRTRRDWHVRFTPPRTSTSSLAFASTFAVDEPPSAGDLLGHVTAEWHVSKGWLGDERFRTRLTLRYQPE